MTVQPKQWRVAPPVPQAHLDRFPQLLPLVVQVLHNRGLKEPGEVQAFLRGEWEVDNPFLLRGMNKAVGRLRWAIRRGESIAVYGDFDADGVTATALLVQTLEALGAQVRPYIPNRDAGYGLNKGALRRLAQQGIQLVVTVDCGIRSIDEVSYGRRLGLDIIITDHHSAGEELPPATVSIDPKRAGERYPFRELSGVGLAFKLAQGLLRANRQVPLKKGRRDVGVEEATLLDLVALGTVADIVPLLGENRTLVKRGLVRLNDPQRPGLKAMMAQAGVQPGQVSAFTIGYVLGPRLNAAGRLADAMTSYELLVSDSPEKAEKLAQELEEQNRERQRLTAETFERAREQVLDRGAKETLLFAAAEDFPSGVVGLAASRLLDEFYRPALVVKLGPEHSRGSARSIPEFHITDALDRCRELLIRHGGHAAAAGFTVANDKLAVFEERMRRIADEKLADLELAPVLDIDAEVDLAHLDRSVHAQIAWLEPFGEKNPAPLFLSRRLLVKDCRAVGADARHLKLTVSDGRASWDAIAFRQGEKAKDLPDYIDVVYSLEMNEWNDQRRLQLNVQDLRPSATQVTGGS